jgi:hypothetical protein
MGGDDRRPRTSCSSVRDCCGPSPRISAPPSPISPRARRISTLNCYKVKDLKSPRFVIHEDVPFSDQFATGTIDVKKPYLLCSPASLGSPVADPTTHLCCYKTKAPALPAPVSTETSDGFGSLQVQIKKSSLVCLPCTQTPLP